MLLFARTANIGRVNYNIYRIFFQKIIYHIAIGQIKFGVGRRNNLMLVTKLFFDIAANKPIATG
jgi:hypothetical protein